jgi:hypothetical protein
MSSNGTHFRKSYRGVREQVHASSTAKNMQVSVFNSRLLSLLLFLWTFEMIASLPLLPGWSFEKHFCFVVTQPSLADLPQ